MQIVIVATNMGILVDGVVIILGVDRLLDRCRMAVNITGDLLAAVLLRAVGRNPDDPA